MNVTMIRERVESLVGSPYEGVTTAVELITPEIAAEWLGYNTNNRNIIKTAKAKYVRDMEAGRWLLTGEAIMFGASGRLLNGQHRLLSCIASGVSFYAVVVRGLPNEEEVMKVIDTPGKRRVADMLQISGEKNVHALAAIVNTCWRYEFDRLGSTTWPTHTESDEWFQNNLGVREAIPVTHFVYKAVKAPGAAVGSAYYLNARSDPESADKFWESAASGEGLLGGDPILAWRRWAIAAVRGKRKPESKEWVAVCLKAMNQWREGRSVRLLAWKETEQMPELWK